MYIKVDDRILIEKVNKCCNKDSLPKDIDDWLERIVFKEHRYMFYKKTDKQLLGYCQNCKSEDIPIKKTKTQKFVNCPYCHKKMKLRNIKYQYVNDSDYFQYVTQLDEESFILRTFKVIKESSFLKVKYCYLELERCLFKVDFFNSNIYFKKYFRLYDFKWTLGFYKNMSYTLPNVLYVYNKNLSVFYKGCLKYVPLQKLCLKTSIDLVSFFETFNKLPQLEYMIKLNLINVVKDLSNLVDSGKKYGFNVTQNNIKKYFGLESRYFSYLLKHNLNVSAIENLKHLQNLKIQPNVNNLEFIDLVMRCFYDYEIFNKINFYSLKDYYYTILKSPGRLRDYRDYLNFAKELKYDLTDTKYLKPKDFVVAHDMAYKKIECIRNKKLYSQVKTACKKYIGYGYISKEYSIVVPTSATDIKEEGKAMHNCVATYLDRVAKRQSIILFVRHTSSLEESFYTLEINPKDNSVVQCRGYHNGKTPEEDAVQRFVKQWHDNVLLKAV